MGGIVLGSMAISAISGDVLPYISVAIKVSILKFNMQYMENNIAKRCLAFILNLKLLI